MKKTLGILTLVLALSTPAWAIDCEDGILITGKNGREYCISTVDVTWWSAFSWCEGHGLTLVSLDDCEYNGETYHSANKCPNFVDSYKSDWVAWTSTPRPYYPHDSYVTTLNKGQVYGYNRASRSGVALCK